jgi:nucleotide-binding universal stress UspA family protein
VPWAADLARLTGARVTLAEVHRGLPVGRAGASIPEFDPVVDARRRRREEDYVTARGEALRLRLPNVDTVVLEGSVVPALAGYAEEEGVDLVVMSSHARSGAGRLWHGSVAETLVRRLTAPVLVLPPSDRFVPQEPTRAFQRILVPLDGSPASEAVLVPAKALATLTGATLHLVMAPLIGFPLAAGDLLPLVSEDETLWFREDAAAYLQAVALRLAATGQHATTEVLDAVLPGPAILDRAAAPDIDLVAITTLAGPVMRGLVGSLADQLLREVKKPLLAVYRGVRQSAAELAREDATAFAT